MRNFSRSKKTCSKQEKMGEKGCSMNSKTMTNYSVSKKTCYMNEINHLP
jgi:hypothetical protein